MVIQLNDDGKVSIVVEFTSDSESLSRIRIPFLINRRGGLELLFSNQRKHQLALPSTDETGLSANLAFLVRYLCEHLMEDQRKEMFVIDGAVLVVALPALLREGLGRADKSRRPGILVLVNDADWELEGEDQYELKRNDNILFVSTLHGG